MLNMIWGCNCSESSLTSASRFSVFCQTLAPDLDSVGWFSPVLASSPPERLLLLFPGGREELADSSGSAQLTLRCLQVHSTKSCWKEEEEEQKPAGDSEEAAVSGSVQVSELYTGFLSKICFKMLIYKTPDGLC